MKILVRALVFLPHPLSPPSSLRKSYGQLRFYSSYWETWEELMHQCLTMLPTCTVFQHDAKCKYFAYKMPDMVEVL